MHNVPDIPQEARATASKACWTQHARTCLNDSLLISVAGVGEVIFDKRSVSPNALVQLQARYTDCRVAASDKCLSAATIVRQRVRRTHV